MQLKAIDWSSIHLQSVYLCKHSSYTVLKIYSNLEDLNLMEKAENCQFKIYCLFDSKISPSLWTVCDASSLHTKICPTNYGFGLGCNSIGSR